MTAKTPTLHMLCGKIGSGKSTLAAELGRAPGTVVISEDDWLYALFSDELATASDYITYSARFRKAIRPHISALLDLGVSVVLDFQANTIESRNWLLGIINSANVSHQLHYLAPPDEVCLARLHKRNSKGDHPFAATEAQFHQFSKHFVEPTAAEGFNIIRH